MLPPFLWNLILNNSNIISIRCHVDLCYFVLALHYISVWAESVFRRQILFFILVSSCGLAGAPKGIWEQGREPLVHAGWMNSPEWRVMWTAGISVCWFYNKLKRFVFKLADTVCEFCVYKCCSINPANKQTHNPSTHIVKCMSNINTQSRIHILHL